MNSAGEGEDGAMQFNSHVGLGNELSEISSLSFFPLMAAPLRRDIHNQNKTLFAHPTTEYMNTQWT